MTTFLARYVGFVIRYLQLFCKYASLSLYSPEFYQDIFRNFRGWGIRYIFTATFIATLIAAVFFFRVLEDIRDYFVHDKISLGLNGLDHIINQFPSLNYDGRAISIDEEQPYYIYNLNDKAIAVIDTEAKDYKTYTQEKIILTKDSVLINLKLAEIRDSESVVKLQYTNLFGLTPQLINIIDLKRILGEVLETVLNVFIYIIFPIVLVINLFLILLQKAINIIIIYIFLNMFVGKALIKDAFRLVMFASAVPIILSQVALSFPVLKGIPPLIELWALMLMVYGLYRLKA
ncbi:MAG: hypothetical protein K0Q51_97 [Rickettsiaceae bacterium]|jgi:hypothetical protein|nr:hypothetical protein [Rickettsiaceae bacterium]